MFITQLEEFHPPLVNCVGDCLNGQRKEKCQLDFSQKLGLAYKEENTRISFCCCVQETYLKNIHLSSYRIKWNQ